MRAIGKFLFKYRSYTPLPFFFIMILFMHPTLITIGIGLPIVLAGELIRLWAVSYAGSETRTTEGVGGSNLVTQGPFSVVRNPLYLGNVLIYTGLGIMSFALFPYIQIFAFLYFTFQYYCIILNEEDYLKTAFSDKYSVYIKSVNRFFPFVNKIPESIKSNLSFDLKSGLKSESRSLQSIGISVAIIIIYYFFFSNKMPI